MFVCEREWQYEPVMHIYKEAAVTASERVNLLCPLEDTFCRILSTHFQIFRTNQTKTIEIPINNISSLI